MSYLFVLSDGLVIFVMSSGMKKLYGGIAQHFGGLRVGRAVL
jgi:hypothetical protein